MDTKIVWAESPPSQYELRGTLFATNLKQWVLHFHEKTRWHSRTHSATSSPWWTDESSSEAFHASDVSPKTRDRPYNADEMHTKPVHKQIYRVVRPSSFTCYGFSCKMVDEVSHFHAYWFRLVIVVGRLTNRGRHRQYWIRPKQKYLSDRARRLPHPNRKWKKRKTVGAAKWTDFKIETYDGPRVKEKIINLFIFTTVFWGG